MLKFLKRLSEIDGMFTDMQTINSPTPDEMGTVDQMAEPAMQGESQMPVQTSLQQCQRNCVTTYSGCLAEVPMGADEMALTLWTKTCMVDFQACLDSCEQVDEGVPPPQEMAPPTEQPMNSEVPPEQQGMMQ